MLRPKVLKHRRTDWRLRKRRKVKSNPHVHFLQRRLAQPLSPRELQVLSALGNGKKTSEICAALNVNTKTVHAYCHRLKTKLQLETLNQLICAAALLREGIIPSSPNESNGRSLRVYPSCKQLFSVKRAKEATPELAAYRVLDAVLRQNSGDCLATDLDV
jgi:DNA-binding CsgD family transcriptional regulator